MLLTTKQFADKMSRINNELILLSEYKNTKTKVLVADKYGILSVFPYDIISGAKPCITSALDKQLYFKNRVKEINKDVEVVSLYRGALKKVYIEYNGNIHCVTAGELLRGYNINIESAVDKRLFFSRKAELIHDGRYTYEKVKYTGCNSKILITCPIHGDFNQRASHHLDGANCPKCSRFGWWTRDNFIKKAKSKKCLCYVVKCHFKDEIFYKIGITSVNLDKRLYGIRPYEFEVVKTFKGDAGYVWDKEKFLHDINKKHKYNPNVYFAGETECFSEIILE